MKNKQVQKKFTVGDEWLYYKLYCGVKTADAVLLEMIEPLTKKLITKKLIDKWFFIRYSDPEPHLRIRFHLLNIEEIGNIIIEIKKALTSLIDSNQILDVQLATYNREIQRYGKDTIEEAELFFFYDSQQIISIIQNSKNDESRFLLLFNWLEKIISSFNFKDENILSFLDRMQEQFKNEFNVDKKGKKELNTKYRNLEPLIFEENNVNFLQKDSIKKIVENILMIEKNNKLEADLENLLASFIHMSINRCFRSNQRIYEMMLYDFLYKKDKSKFVRYGKL